MALPPSKTLDQLLIAALHALPKNTASRAFGALSEVEFPAPLQRALNHGFASLYGIDIEEAEHAPHRYRSLNAFFTRRLKPGRRGVDLIDPSALYSPVDGLLTQFNAITQGTLVQAKGRDYPLVDLVDSAEEAERFERGAYATIYLSPKDYHRIHSPVSGRVAKISYVPGQLWPVNPLSVRRVDRLFALNERLIVYLESERLGRVAVIMVGATCVGRIGLAFDPLQSNRSWRRRQERELLDELKIGVAEELGVFNLGSTVILLVEHDRFAWRDDLIDGQGVRLGEELGTIG